MRTRVTGAVAKVIGREAAEELAAGAYEQPTAQRLSAYELSVLKRMNGPNDPRCVDPDDLKPCAFEPYSPEL